MVGMVKEFSDYSEFVRAMEAEGWYREQLSIDELNTTLVATSSVAAAGTGVVVTVTCPAGRIITTKGVEQIPAGADRGSAHALVLRLAGTDETELSRRVKLKIEKVKPSEEVTMLSRDFYSMFSLTKQGGATPVDKADNEIYRWRRGIVLYGEEKMKVSIASAADIAVNSAYVRCQLDLDLWTKRM